MGIARSELYPTVAAAALAGVDRDQAYLADRFFRQTIGDFQVALNLNYTIFDFGARAGRISAAKAEALAANFAFNDSHREGQLSNTHPGMGADVYVLSKPNVRFSGIVDSVGFGVTPDPDVIGKLEKGLPDVQRMLNWVHLASRYPVRVRVENPSPELFRVGDESAVVTIRAK